MCWGDLSATAAFARVHLSILAEKTEDGVDRMVVAVIAAHYGPEQWGRSACGVYLFLILILFPISAQCFARSLHLSFPLFLRCLRIYLHINGELIFLLSVVGPVPIQAGGTAL